MITAGRDDSIFALDAARQDFEHAQRIYAAAGAPASLRLSVRDGGHRYYAEPVWPWPDELFGRGR